MCFRHRAIGGIFAMGRLVAECSERSCKRFTSLFGLPSGIACIRPEGEITEGRTWKIVARRRALGSYL
jgi:hypothetical protein